MLNLELKINIKFGAEILSWSKIEKMELYLKAMMELQNYSCNFRAVRSQNNFDSKSGATSPSTENLQ